VVQGALPLQGKPLGIPGVSVGVTLQVRAVGGSLDVPPEGLKALFKARLGITAAVGEPAIQCCCGKDGDGDRLRAESGYLGVTKPKLPTPITDPLGDLEKVAGCRCCGATTAVAIDAAVGDAARGAAAVVGVAVVGGAVTVVAMGG